jgi:NADP-dependent aldehyde dehydrogenase
MGVRQVLIGGVWQPSEGTTTFRAMNPAVKQPLPEEFPVSPWREIERALEAAAAAFEQVRGWPGSRFAEFLEEYARRIEATGDEMVSVAHRETGLPVEPRLKSVELPRTTNQLRQAAAAAREGSWVMATIDEATNIRSMFAPIGPVAVFGPNNFPCAFNSAAGGDFAAAVAAGNPVIAKGNSSHPETTRLFAVAALQAATETGMPPGFVQLLYRASHADGARLVSHPLLGATGYTGSRDAGLILKQAADSAGKPIYLELSSINPVFVLPGALAERREAIVEEFTTSCLMGAGQFCTNPGMVIVRQGPESERFLTAVAEKFRSAAAGTLLSEGVEQQLRAGVASLRQAGAEVVTGDQPVDTSRCCYANTLLRVTGGQFLRNPQGLQREAFGNCSLFVVAEDDAQLIGIARALEGNLTGCFYTSTAGADDPLYDRLAPCVRQRVGRLLNDRMPTGVAVTPAMNHGGPFPATGHPGFTAVGLPAAMLRFAMLQCYDSVRPHRLPPALQNANPTGSLWRRIGGTWSQRDL